MGESSSSVMWMSPASAEQTQRSSTLWNQPPTMSPHGPVTCGTLRASGTSWICEIAICGSSALPCGARSSAASAPGSGSSRSCAHQAGGGSAASGELASDSRHSSAAPSHAGGSASRKVAQTSEPASSPPETEAAPRGEEAQLRSDSTGWPASDGLSGRGSGPWRAKEEVAASGVKTAAVGLSWNSGGAPGWSTSMPSKSSRLGAAVVPVSRHSWKTLHGEHGTGGGLEAPVALRGAGGAAAFIMARASLCARSDWRCLTICSMFWWSRSIGMLL
mmetsp:Transcript_24684/g.62645  ORF Transcript_24684/g.62645 Transcript_24684/m.62645 type:complete len:275 (+) Transcript_24684:380-1204(+)